MVFTYTSSLVWKKSLRSENKFFFTFSFSERHTVLGVSLLLFGGVGNLEAKDSLKLDVCCLPYTSAGGWGGILFPKMLEKNFFVQLSQGNRVFLGKKKKRKSGTE